MTADTLKTTRVLELYQDFLSGKLINKQQAAEQYHVNLSWHIARAQEQFLMKSSKKAARWLR